MSMAAQPTDKWLGLPILNMASCCRLARPGLGCSTAFVLMRTVAMISEPILLMGGTGAIGRLSAHALRAVYPDVPLLIGGRDLLKSREFASELGQAEGVV